MTKIMIIAGEVSGDMHAAALVKAANRLNTNLQWFGIGGSLMRSAGVETLHDISEMAVVGLAEVLKRYLFFRRVFFEMLDVADKRRPDVVILVDYPGFNLRLAERLHKRGIKVVYYICPQVWAWHRERIPKMAKIIDHLITIFPFEADHFAGTGLRVTYAGHPLVDEIHAALQNEPEELPWKSEKHIALLPGSRLQEIRRLLPDMWKAAAIIERNNHETSFIIAAAGSEQSILMQELIQNNPGPKNFSIVVNKTRDILRTSHAAMVASGTATVETALLRCPMVVVYRVNGLTYHILKHLVKVDNIGMVNVLAGKQICPELIQHELTPQKLAKEMLPLIDETPQRKRMLNELNRVISLMGKGGTAQHAAQILLDQIGL